MDAISHCYTFCCSLYRNSPEIINLQDCDKYTPLHYAASNGHLKVVKLLLNKGAKIDAKDKFGDTPVHSAVVGGYAEYV